MREPFLAEIKFVPAHAAPEGWAWCDGRKLRIAEHPALFELLGTTFGGDGQYTFALPNLVGRKPIHIKLHAEILELANQSSRPRVLERSDQPHPAWPNYESTYFCIALKGTFPLSNKAPDVRPTFL
ncbi:phage tail protein [Dyadobacter arcticus]|uniref:Microcystin-dependent protein n=1 Tax=Dyadobacter arcticus TaxID=1078754 RepID=A0ABX0UHD3_9BACT|nr:tail fiber protein [Dyadobacter arcticus]NIJ52429.1 microcystin-dependent protein [Dyadobacter arcticus]